MFDCPEQTHTSPASTWRLPDPLTHDIGHGAGRRLQHHTPGAILPASTGSIFCVAIKHGNRFAGDRPNPNADRRSAWMNHVVAITAAI
jgi:hypothetical protein